MSDKFDKMSIYAQDFKLIDEDGEEHNFTFKPLPFGFYPKVYEVFGKLQDMNEATDSIEDEDEKGKRFLSLLTEPTLKLLLELEKEMVKRSYPDLNEEKVESFVQSNVFELIEPLTSLSMKQEKANARKVQKIVQK